MSQGLSPAAEAALLSAVSDVCDLVESGESPTKALTKIAGERNLLPDMIRLVAVGYNTGAVNTQREGGESTLAKFATVPLADPAAVIATVYPPVKVASDEVSPQYRSPPRENRQRTALAGSVLRKSAADAAVLLEREKQATAVPLQREPEPVADLLRKTAKHKQELELLRTKAGQALDALNMELARLVDRTKKMALAGTLAAGEVRYLSRALLGQAGLAVCKYAFDRAGCGDVPEQTNQAPADPTVEPLAGMSRCVARAEEFSRARDAYGDKLARVLLEDVAAAAELLPLAPVRGSVLASRRAAAKAASEQQRLGKAANLVSLLIASNAAKNLIGASAPSQVPSLVGRYAEKLSDPDHENELRAIRTEAMLRDMVNSDEVLVGYPPSRVLQAYNELSQLSPRAATQPAVVRPLLRKIVSGGGLESFDTREMADIEKTLATTARPHTSVSGDSYESKPSR